MFREFMVNFVRGEICKILVILGFFICLSHSKSIINENQQNYTSLYYYYCELCKTAVKFWKIRRQKLPKTTEISRNRLLKKLQNFGANLKIMIIYQVSCTWLISLSSSLLTMKDNYWICFSTPIGKLEKIRI